MENKDDLKVSETANNIDNNNASGADKTSKKKGKFLNLFKKKEQVEAFGAENASEQNVDAVGAEDIANQELVDGQAEQLALSEQQADESGKEVFEQVANTQEQVAEVGSAEAVADGQLNDEGNKQSEPIEQQVSSSQENLEGVTSAQEEVTEVESGAVAEGADEASGKEAEESEGTQFVAEESSEVASESAVENASEEVKADAGEQKEEAPVEEVKKPKWAFPKKMTEGGKPKLFVTDEGEIKTEDEFKKYEEQKLLADTEEEIIEEEVLDEEGQPIFDELTDENSEIVEEEEVIEEEEEVEEEGQTILPEAVEAEPAQEGSELVEGKEAMPEQAVADGTAEAGEQAVAEGKAVASKAPKETHQYTSSEKTVDVSGIAKGLSEVDNSALIEANEKKRAKFSLFPKKSDGTGAVNGEGYSKKAVLDDTRSVRKFRQEANERSEADIENKIKKPKPLWLKVSLASVAVIMGIVVILGGYVGYLQMGHDRVYDWKYIETFNNRATLVLKNNTYDAITYNINYGMMNQEMSYAGSVGYMASGAKVTGSETRAISKERAKINVNGSAGFISSGENENVDFLLLQQIDIDSTRSYYLNEKDLLDDILINYASVYAECGTSNYVLGSMFGTTTGKTESKMATYSKHKVNFAIRYSLPSNEKFLEKYGTNDNCVIVTRFKISGVSNKYLSVVNVHISRYENEEVRRLDIQAIYDIMNTEKNVNGNYCVVGGSFAYLLNGTDGEFKNSMETPSWGTVLPDCFSEESLKNIGFSICKDAIAIDQGIGTARDASIAYSRGTNYEAITDGFIVSDDIVVESTKVLDNNYLYSSHNPVKIRFRLIT